MVELDFEHLADYGFPYCPYCAKPLAWESDFMLSEIGYITEEMGGGRR